MREGSEPHAAEPPRLALVVTGGRDFDDRAVVSTALSAALLDRPFTALFHGDARGADRLAASECFYLSPSLTVYAVPADWGRWGKAAGMRRNVEMLKAAIEYAGSVQNVLLLAFPGGVGTAGCCAAARELGVHVQHVP